MSWRVTLPAGIAYLGGVVFSSNPNSVSTTPTLKLNTDGSLDLSWSLGTLTTAQHTTPVTISFQAAIPYRFRTAANNAARNGPFAGPMSGAVIAEDTVMPVQYEATGTYAGAPTADGSESTPTTMHRPKPRPRFLRCTRAPAPPRSASAPR